MKTRITWPSLIVWGAVAGLGSLQAAELKPAAKAAWDAYVHATDLRMQSLGSSGAFLWADGTPDRIERVRSGVILVAPGTGNGTRSVPGGLIHHWLGTAFVPHTTTADVLRIAHDYPNFKQYYRPDVVESRLLSSAGDERSFSMRSVHRVLFVTAVVESEFTARDVRVGPTRWYSVADSTRVQEVDNYGRPDEHLVPSDRGRGYVWGLHTITRYEERDGGVYIEMEAIGLSRDIPVALRWLVNPAVARFSRSALIASLRQTREAVTAARAPEQRLSYTAGTLGAGGR